MTVARTPGTIEAVLMEAISVLPPYLLEQATGKSSNYFRKISNPDSHYQLSARDAAILDGLMQALGHGAPFTVWHQQEARRAQEAAKASAPAMTVEASLTKITCELGDLARAVQAALADGEIDRNERREIAKEANELGAAAYALRDQCNACAALKAVGGAA
jgi:hypothetical protein